MITYTRTHMYHRIPFCRFQLSATWATVLLLRRATSLISPSSDCMDGRYSRKSRARGPLGNLSKLYLSVSSPSARGEYLVEM